MPCFSVSWPSLATGFSRLSLAFSGFPGLSWPRLSPACPGLLWLPWLSWLSLAFPASLALRGSPLAVGGSPRPCPPIAFPGAPWPSLAFPSPGSKRFGIGYLAI